MSLTWHIIRKDLVRFRVPLLAWIGLMVFRHLFFAYISGVFGAPDIGWINRWGNQFDAVLITFLLDPLIICFLAAALVFEDPPGAASPFWITRPISGGRLLSAKLLGALLIFVLLPLALNLAWWLACGFSWAQIAVYAEVMVWVYLVAALVALAGASSANGYPRFVLWTLAASAVVIGVHLAVGPAETTAARPMRGLSSLLPVAHLAALIAGGMAVIALEIICYRYLFRQSRRGIALAVGLTLAGSVAVFSSRLGTWLDWSEPPVPPITGENFTRISLAGPTHHHPRGIELPLQVELPATATANLSLTGTWRTKDGKVWKLHGIQFSQALTDLAVRRALGLPRHEGAVAVFAPFSLQPRNAAQILSESTTFEGQANVSLQEVKLVAEVPLRTGMTRFSGGSFTITDVVREPERVSFTFTARNAPVFANAIGPGYVVLVNRRTNEISDHPKTNLTLTSSTAMLLDLVLVSSVRLGFDIPTTPGWADEATIALFGFRAGHTLTRQIEPPSENAPPPPPAPPEPASITLPRETLDRYAGRYQPPGVSWVLKLNVEKDHLVGRAPDTPDATLVPISEKVFLVSLDDHSNRETRIEFVTDADNKVTHFVIRENGREAVVPRIPAAAPPKPATR